MIKEKIVLPTEDLFYSYALCAFLKSEYPLLIKDIWGNFSEFKMNRKKTVFIKENFYKNTLRHFHFMCYSECVEWIIKKEWNNFLKFKPYFKKSKKWNLSEENKSVLNRPNFDLLVNDEQTIKKK